MNFHLNNYLYIFTLFKVQNTHKCYIFIIDNLFVIKKGN